MRFPQLIFRRQTFETFRTAPDPRYLERHIPRIGQCRPNGVGFRWIVVDQQYILMH
jgi:hypothetical protein